MMTASATTSGGPNASSWPTPPSPSRASTTTTTTTTTPQPNGSSSSSSSSSSPSTSSLSSSSSARSSSTSTPFVSIRTHLDFVGEDDGVDRNDRDRTASYWSSRAWDSQSRWSLPLRQTANTSSSSFFSFSSSSSQHRRSSSTPQPPNFVSWLASTLVLSLAKAARLLRIPFPRKRPSRCVLVSTSIAAIFFLTLFLSPLARHRFIYGTRPLWERAEKPWTIIPHYYAEDTPLATLCPLHGWVPLDKPRQVYDAILFANELDILEIRMIELLPVVTKFLIVESNTTFTGLPKPLVFAENQKRFAFAADKIEYIMFPGRTLRPGEQPFDLEKRQRIEMSIHLRDMLYKGILKIGDIMIMSDVDEIPSRQAINLARGCEGVPPVLHLGMRNFLYSFDFLLDMDHWRAKVSRVTDRPDTFLYTHSRKGDVLLADAGWHCSFCFPRIQDFVFKMTGYSHADRVVNRELLDPKRIQRVICEGSDIFGMMPEAHRYRDLIAKWGPAKPRNSMVQVPRHVVRGASEGRFKYLLPGGCMREP
ncbi:glycosyltransferase family 17-domain-containing protein [Zopfochytrium polystomum]|nr:glycosyltransferase family 17-domain-containing protein [Zopfochytrium polystomum]